MSRDGPLEKHPGDLQMGLPVGIREGKTSGHRINPPDMRIPLLWKIEILHGVL